MSFRPHLRRPASSLGGLWDFAFLGSVDLDGHAPGAVRRTERTLVPSCFDALPDLAGKRGAAIYRLRVHVPPEHPARLEFGAVSMWCRVYVDGVPLREHACGYAPFTVDIPPSPRAGRDIEVLVDNRYDFARVPMHEEYFDFYQYGGIVRDVVLHVLPRRGPFLDSIQVIPGDGYQDGEARAVVRLGGELPPRVRLAIRLDDGEAEVREAEVRDGAVSLDLRVPRPRVWSPDSPALHRLRVSLLDAEGEADDLAVRFGLRRIEAREGRLWLNGDPLFLRGYNRHEWHPNFGPCTPPLQMAADLQLLRDLGCNFIRGSHYPQDQAFLDLCDELGFLVWEENLGWGQREKTFADAKFRRDHAESLRAMVRASANHPSVVIWGFLNEAGTDADYVRPVFEETAATLRALDPSRLVSYATMFPLDDRHYDLADLISINVYPGWYNCEGVAEPLDLIAPFLRRCFGAIDEKGFAAKPVIVSEIGAEGLYGWHDAHNDFFTEEHQAEYLRRACAEALENPRCSGIALWHFSDVRTYGGGWSLKRPRAFNNKGTLDEYRRPKLAYRAVRDLFRGPTHPRPQPRP